jgi:hypothetical protein
MEAAHFSSDASEIFLQIAINHFLRMVRKHHRDFPTNEDKSPEFFIQFREFSNEIDKLVPQTEYHEENDECI